jgi:dihydrofolate reductase
MIHLIAAVDENGGIGKDNHLLCHLPADLAHFKELTMGHAMIMGRKTFDSLPGILPGRQHIVVTHQRDFSVADDRVVVYHSVEDVCRDLDDSQSYFVIGGGSLYREFIDRAESLFITAIEAVFPADTFFPAIDTSWQLIADELHESDAKNKYTYRFRHYMKIK